MSHIGEWAGNAPQGVQLVSLKLTTINIGLFGVGITAKGLMLVQIVQGEDP